MKKILLILLPILFLGCDLYYDNIYSNLAMGHSLYEADFGDIEEYTDIALYIRNNIEYRSESIDIWDDPYTTIIRGYGDCDDMAILFMNIAYFELGIKMDLVCVDQSKVSRSIVEGGFIDHIMVYYDEKIIEPVTGLYYDVPIGYIYTFDEVFN